MRACHPDALRMEESDRELLVVAGRPHGYGDRLAANADLEWLFDGQFVPLRLAVGQTQHLDTRRRLRGDDHCRQSVATNHPNELGPRLTVLGLAADLSHAVAHLPRSRTWRVPARSTNRSISIGQAVR